MPLLSEARSWAAVLAHAHNPARAVLDRARVGMGCTTEYEVMKQRRPHSCSRMWGTA